MSADPNSSSAPSSTPPSTPQAPAAAEQPQSVTPPPPIAARRPAAPRNEGKAEKPAAKPAPAPAQAAPARPPRLADEEPADDEMADKEFEAAMSGEGGSEAQESVAPGEIRQVKIIDVGRDAVFVDIGDKAEGSIPIAEFQDYQGNVSVKKDDLIHVEIRGRDEQGQFRVSYRSAMGRLAISFLEEAREKKIPVKARVVEVVKGGVKVDLGPGISAFMPASQCDIRRVDDLAKLVGEQYDVYVTEFQRQRRRAVVSRRELLSEETKGRRSKVMDAINVGDLRTGTVKNIQDFGVFVDLGGVDGFIPREEVSYDRGAAPSQFFKVGDAIEVKVIRLDKETGKIGLSRKQLKPDPWAKAEELFPAGRKVTGKVVSVTHFGAFVYLEEGITGMIHATDMTWSLTGSRKPADFVKEGDTVEAVVLELDLAKRRLALGLKQVTHDPWAEVASKYPEGSKVKGKVTSVTQYGAFVRLDEYIEALIHVSDMSWDKKVNDPKQVVKVDQELEAVVLKADPNARRLSLGIKQLTDSPWESLRRRHPERSTVTAPITRLAEFGAFVDLGDGIEGLLHISQWGEERVEKIEQVAKVGDKVTVKVSKIDQKNQKVSLSRKDALKDMDRQMIQEYMGSKSTMRSGTNLGELLRQAQTKAAQPPADPPTPKVSG